MRLEPLSLGRALALCVALEAQLEATTRLHERASPEGSPTRASTDSDFAKRRDGLLESVGLPADAWLAARGVPGAWH